MESLKETVEALQDPLRVYSAWFDKTGHAVCDYRIRIPLAELARQRKISFLFDDGRQDSATRRHFMEQMDILYYHLLVDQPVFKQALIPREKRSGLIFGADDDVENISPYNPAFIGLGTRDQHGRVMEPGDGVATPDGVPLWVDGQEYPGKGVFNLESNHFRLQLLKGIASEVDGVIASCERLREVYEGYGARRVLVLPNLLDFTKWPTFPIVYPDNEVRILWQGAASHYEDWYPIRASLIRVLKKYPQAKFVYWGHVFPWVTKGMPQAQTEFIDWVDHHAFITRLCTIGHDIALAPLSKSTFALAKTPIKWYESAAIPHHPAATLAANYGPFADEMEDGATGLLYNTADDFEFKLGELIEDATLRKQLASNAQDWVHTHRDVRTGVDGLFQFLKEIDDEGREARRPQKRRLVVVGSDEPSHEPVRDEPLDQDAPGDGSAGVLGEREADDGAGPADGPEPEAVHPIPGCAAGSPAEPDGPAGHIDGR